MLKGIDISNWQHGLDPAAMNVDFIIAKATEGLGYVDNSCDGFVQKAIQSGKLWGFYHFARENKPEDEADFFYRSTKNYFTHGIPVLDYETTNYSNVDWCERFVSKLHDLSGIWPLLYISASRCGEYADSWIPEKCGLWLAGYPAPYADWIEDASIPYNTFPFSVIAIWQFTSSLQLQNWNGNLDGNIAYMDANGWKLYANPNNIPADDTEPIQPILDYHTLAFDVLKGNWGNGATRYGRLENAGYDYDTVQEIINHWYTLADQVIDGRWGNGWNRQNALGRDYEPVQFIVNEKLKG